MIYLWPHLITFSRIFHTHKIIIMVTLRCRFKLGIKTKYDLGMKWPGYNMTSLVLVSTTQDNRNMLINLLHKYFLILKIFFKTRIIDIKFCCICDAIGDKWHCGAFCFLVRIQMWFDFIMLYIHQ